MGTSGGSNTAVGQGAAEAQVRLATPLALAAIAVVTVGWWAAALWPLPASTPEWVVRARAACFGSTDSGLPNSGGWIMLIGTPITMVTALMVIAGGEVRASTGALLRTPAGRWTAGVSAAALIALATLAAGRVASAYGYAYGAASGRGWAGGVPAVLSASELPRLGAAAPDLELIDQHGSTVRLDEFRGRPVLVTFAYGQCGTVCPVIVNSVLRAREEVEEMDPVVLVVTLDPWRDTPSRLPHIATSWGMTGDARLLGGPVARVEAALDAWAVQRDRDRRTGEIDHASLVYVIDRDGRIAFTATGSAGQVAGALRRLDEEH